MDENSFLFTALSISIPIIAMIVVFRAVTHGSAWIRVRFKDIRRGDHVVLSANILTQILKGITRLILIAVVVIPLLIVVGPFLFQTFPEMKQLMDEVLTALFDKFSAIGEWFIGFLPHLIFWLIVIVVAVYLIKLARLFFDEVDNGDIVLPGFNTDWTETTFQLTRVVIVALALIAIYTQTPGSNTPTVQAIILLTTLLAGLGAQDVISNIFSGLVLTYSNAFQLGHTVRIGDVTGRVVRTSILQTVVQTVDDREVSIPNKEVLGNQVDNFSILLPPGKMSIQISVGYSVPWRKVHELMLNAAHATTDVLADPPPAVLQLSFKEVYVVYQLDIFTQKKYDREEIISELHQNIQDNFSKESITLGTPIEQYLQLLKGNEA